MMRYIYLLLVSFFIFACSGLDIKVLNERDYYSEEFLKKIQSIQIIYRDGDKQVALSKLNEISDESITQGEKAKKYNLRGVFLYSLGDVDNAIESFNTARMNVKKDEFLVNNIHLNLASSYYKLKDTSRVMDNLNLIDKRYLKEKEKENFHRLMFLSANESVQSAKVVESLVYLMRKADSFKEVSDYKYREALIHHYKKLTDSERIFILDGNQDRAPIVCAYLAREEAMQRFYKGNHDGAQDIVDWLEKNFITNNDVAKFVKDYRFRIENYSKVNSKLIGMVAPLNGKLGKYGKKVMSGLNTALSKSTKGKELNILVKNNENNEFLARKQVQDLAVNHNASIIIGGLFPHLAKAEYLEAKKYGVLYISLSAVYLPRSEKNHLLIEIPGSVESQIAEVTKPEFLEKFGKRVSILYPWSDVGHSYVDEFWSIHNSEKISLSNVMDYKKGTLDYRDSVKNLLGLSYPREREEEYKIWSEIKNVNKRRVRIVNVLPPVVDFDWIFIPALPREALQIIPTFSFYDVKRMKFVGGPSWLSKKIQRERKNFSGRIYFVGHDTTKISSEFIKMYQLKNGVKPHLVDTLSYEAGLVALSILGSSDFEEREDLEKSILRTSKLNGMSFEWNFKNGLWIKEMDLLEVRSSEFRKVQ